MTIVFCSVFICSVFVLFCLFCFVLLCFVLFCFVLFCFVLFCFVMSCYVLLCLILYRIVSLIDCNTDEVLAKKVGDTMRARILAVNNVDYTSEASWELYYTTGSAQDWYYDQAKISLSYTV